MKTIVLFFICILMFLTAGCPDASSGRQTISQSSQVNVTGHKNNENLQTNINSNEDSRESPTIAAVRFEFVGCWIGDRGGGLDIDIGEIKHLTPHYKKSYSYAAIPSNRSDDDNTILLQVQGTSNGEFIRPFIGIEFLGKDEILEVDRILLRGYETYEGYLSGYFVTSEYFYRESCSKLRQVQRAH